MSKTHIAIYIGQDGREYGFSRKKLYPNSTPKGALKALVTDELIKTLGKPETPEDQLDLTDCINSTMETFQKAGGGVYVAYAEEGTYVVTAL